MNKITARTIDHDCQRYPTAGDWWFEEGKLEVAASDTKNWRMNALLMVHEIVEAILCKSANIHEPTVRKFDIKMDELDPLIDPGDQTDAPYRRQHCLAVAVERIIAAEMGVSWSEYESALNKLWEEKVAKTDV
jgi:hypothetical protein